MWMAEAIAAKDIHLTSKKKGDKINLTKGVNEPYCLWCGEGIFDLPAHYVDLDSINIINEN